MTSAADVYFDPSALSASSLFSNASQLAAARHSSTPLAVAYQGEPGAYSEQALRALFHESGIYVQPFPCASFSAVFDSLRSNSASFALLPIENSLGGSIHDNYDLLLRNKVTVVAELQFRVSHCLLALPGTKLQDIRVAYSHPQALAQCEEYLSKLSITAEKQYDTAGSAKIIAEKQLKNVAAIASELAASTYGLEVIARRIEDDEGNFTRFLLLAPATTLTEQAVLYSAPPPVPVAASAFDVVSPNTAAEHARGRSGSVSQILHPNVSNLNFNPHLTRVTFKTSLVFTLPDAPGTLFKALSVFALRDMHLCKIESRPCKNANFLKEEALMSFAEARRLAQDDASVEVAPTADNSFRYLFFIDTLSSLSQNESLKNGVRHLKEYAPFLRVMGSYPVFQLIPAAVPVAVPAVHHAPTASLSQSPLKRGLRIGILGFGTFGQFLSKTFLKQGHSIFVNSRSDYSALSQQLGVEWVPTMEGLCQSNLDVLIFSTSILSFADTVEAFPWAQLKNCLVVDVLSVKLHPKTILTAKLGKLADKSLDILCTHPMFGPQSGMYSWKGLAFMYDKVRVAVEDRAQRFLDSFGSEGCRMLEMSCELHDEYAAGSQFLTHTTGRVLSQLNPISTPINTAGYTKLLQVIEQTQKDSWELYAGLYKYNAKSQEQLEKFGVAFDNLRKKLRDDFNASSPVASASSSSSSLADAFVPAPVPAPVAAPTPAAKTGSLHVAMNPHASRMNESKTVAIADLTKKMLAAGTQVTSLSVGEILSVKTPQVILDATVRALQNGQTTYTATNGVLALRQAICDKLKKENDLDYTSDQIVVSNGAKQAIFQSLQALITPEENEVIIPAPYWVSYPDMVTMIGGKPVLIPTSAEENYILSAQKLEAAITPRTKVLILCTPSNPTGIVYTQAQLMALVHVLERHPKVQIISDEIYEHLLFDGAKHHSFAALTASMYTRTITINGFSKGYVMTGFRVGYVAAGNIEIAKMVNKIQGQITSCSSSISQAAALAALTELPASFHKELLVTLTRTRSLLLEGLRTIPHTDFQTPSGAFYVLLDVSKYYHKKTPSGKVLNDSDDVAMYLLDSHRVALVPGSAFGAPLCLRISYASSDEIVLKGVQAIKDGLAQLS